MMTLHFASFFKACYLILLSCDGRVKALLSKICWFVPVSSLEKDESEQVDQFENDFSVNWSQLWLSAQKLYTAVFDSEQSKLERKSCAKPMIALSIIKRYELLFLFLISSLRHLMTCRHSSGAPGNMAHLFLLPFKSTMRVFAIVLFLLPELNS